MAETFSLQNFHIQTTNYNYVDEVEQEDPTYSISPSNPTFFILSFDDFNWGPDSQPDRSDLIANPNSFLYSIEDQMDFVTDLFDTRNDDVTDHPHVVHSNSIARVLTDGEEVEFGSEFDGLRVVGVESESDSEEMEVISGVIDQTGDSSVPDLWNCFRVDEDFEWEEVDRVEGRDNNSKLSHHQGFPKLVQYGEDDSCDYHGNYHNKGKKLFAHNHVWTKCKTHALNSDMSHNYFNKIRLSTHDDPNRTMFD
ncbi:hypothetical protein RND71_011435 [Anisodus tanguticus]|uniref:Uncharacterized protein n=1 Tax=Anisodus tanguticus TaxID=243964 RepID=A0AAE1VF38_9SOLA|nr:hypothetical protein RND71_011435 [Anisodus tanguticus]